MNRLYTFLKRGLSCIAGYPASKIGRCQLGFIGRSPNVFPPLLAGQIIKSLGLPPILWFDRRRNSKIGDARR